jgi:hypothetical protein
MLSFSEELPFAICNICKMWNESRMRNKCFKDVILLNVSTYYEITNSRTQDDNVLTLAHVG